jgi:serine/threonine protein kinase
MDSSLKRWVTLTLISAEDLRGTRLLAACQAAAGNDRRDVVAILDVIPKATITDEDHANPSDPYIGIVTEWLEGETLDRRIIRTGEVFEAHDALAIAGMLANTLVHSHSEEIFHQRLRPHNITFAEDQGVRISGFGVDSSLLGSDPYTAIESDIRGVGNLLFLMVTGVWPIGSVDSLPSAPAGVTVPSQVSGGVRETIDTIYRRTQNGSFESMRDVVDALTIGAVENANDLQSRVTRLTTTSVSWKGVSEDKDTRLRYTGIAALGVLIFGWIGWQLLTSNFHRSDTPVAILASPLPAASASASPTSVKPLEIMDISDFDPQGDAVENTAKIDLAIDGDKSTKWLTANYKTASMSGKTGVGLILDLGSPRPVTSVSIDFSSIGQLAEVYVTDDAKPDLTTAEKLGATKSAQGTSVVKSPRAIPGRYVVVWITPPLPKTDKGDFQGGIAEIQVGL